MEYIYKTEPYKHQRREFERTRDKRYWALFWEMGTGKSKVICDTMAWQFMEGKIDAAIIFSYNGGYRNWATNEIPKHLPDYINRNADIWKEGTESQQRILYNSLFIPNKTYLQILVMNIEALAHAKGKTAARKFVEAHKTLLVIDESTSIKNPKAARTKAAIELGRKALARRILTGTAIDNNPLNIYSQCDFLERGCIGFKSFYAFRSKFAIMETKRFGARSISVVTGFRYIDHLKEKIRPFSTIVKLREVHDLPPIIYKKYYVELTKEQKELYDKMRKDAVVELNNSVTISAPIVLTKLLRLQQIVCGFLPIDEEKKTAIPHTRLDALEEILDEFSGKAIIWSSHRYCIEEIGNFLKSKYGKASTVLYYGDTNDDARTDARMAFQNPYGKVRFLVGNPTVAGYQITLTAATLAVYYSNSFDAEVRAQSEKRAHRIGQSKTVVVVDLIAKGTVDEKVIDILENKKKLSDSIMLSDWKALFR